MSFVWTCVVIVLLVELFVLALFVAPLPWGVRKNVTRFFHRPAVKIAFHRVHRYIGFGLTLAVIESIQSLQKLHLRLAEATGEGEKSVGETPVHIARELSLHDFRWRRAHTQGNLYLASFCLVLLVTLSRLVELVTNEAVLRNRIKELTSQPMSKRDAKDPVLQGKRSEESISTKR